MSEPGAPVPSPRRAPPWLLPVSIVVGVLALVHAPMFAGRILFFRDLAHYAFPMRHFVAAGFARGDWPWWNPDQGLGFSVLGNPQYGLFYPPHLLFQLVSAERLVTSFWWAHAVWGGLGCAFVARRLGLGRAAMAVAGLAWSLSGLTTAEWSGGMRLPAEAWIPWTALGALRIASADDGDRRDLARATLATALPLGLCFLFGEVFVALMAAGFAMALAAVVHVATPRPRARRALGKRSLVLVGALALGAALGGAVIVPGKRISQSSERAAPLPRAVAERCSVHPARLLELGAPFPWGDPYLRWPSVPSLGHDCIDDKPLELSIYLGASVLALGLVALGRGRRLAAGLLALALAGIALALGRHLPVHAALRTLIPPLAFQRHPEKYLVLLVAPWSLLAAVGAERLVGEAARRAPWARVAVLAGLLALAAALAPAAVPADGVDDFRRGALLGVAGALLVLAISGLRASRPRAATVLLVGAVALDLGSAAVPLQHFGPIAVARVVPPAAEVVRADSRAGPLHPRVFRAVGVDDAIGRRVGAPDYAAGELRWVHSLVTNTANTFGVATVPGYDPALPPGVGRLFDREPAQGQAILSLLATPYLVWPVEDPAAPDHQPGLVALMDPVPGARLYRVRSALPRAYVVGRVRPLADHSAEAHLLDTDVVAGTAAIVADTAPSPPDAARRAAVPPPPQPALPPELAAAPPGRVGDCTFDVFRNIRVEATCRASRTGLAVFVEQHDAGWSASVDGRPAPILRVNLFMRGVALEAGTHRLVMAYAPPGLGAGIALSAVALLGLLALAIVARMGGRASGDGPAAPTSG